ncbi:hypothetical protein CHU95_21805 [Niveispirillum lacus]|uniref:Uncharacterized protein n=1 Tax=Niveispirillum lacus TaxID=1981099 RepID=A0A255YSZ7_9PROT|nr:hypothetical protein [Niveispirillum lacus]OYQ31765.1 hypothetical protein CHU95_21805 [Niveispirillum lacus]
MSKSWTDIPLLPVAWGEVFDKWTILVIKEARIGDPEKVRNVNRERVEIEKVVGDRSRFPAGLDGLVAALHDINAQLWDIEDGKRRCEREKTFDDGFIHLARQVYMKNDERARIKKDINLLLGSAIIEEKSYKPY